jgi:hypothetical protein
MCQSKALSWSLHYRKGHRSKSMRDKQSAIQIVRKVLSCTHIAGRGEGIGNNIAIANSKRILTVQAKRRDTFLSTISPMGQN